MSNLSLDLPIHLDGAQQMLGNKPRKKLGPNTYVEGSTFGACVVYHHTPIITYYPGSFTITNGGYFTPTTKARLNIFLAPYGWQIVQRQGKWFYYSTRVKSVLVPYKNGDTKSMIEARFAEVNGEVH